MVFRVVFLIVVVAIVAGYGLYRVADKTIIPVFNNWCADQDRRAEQKRKRAEKERQDRAAAEAEYERFTREFDDSDGDDENVNA